MAHYVQCEKVDLCANAHKRCDGCKHNTYVHPRIMDSFEPRVNR